MGIHELPPQSVFAALGTSAVGLSEEEAGRRLALHGANILERPFRIPLPIRFLRQFTHFFALLLLAAAAIAFTAHFIRPGEGMALLGAAIVGVVLINATFSFLQEYRAEREVEALSRLLPSLVRVRRGGRETSRNASELVPGDIVLLDEGVRVPADIRLVESHALRADNSSLTGESHPQARDPLALPGTERREAANLVFAGTSVVQGRGTGVVFATGMQTEFGRIARMAGRVREEATPMEEEIVRLSRRLAVIAAGVGIVFFIIGVFLGRGFWQNFVFALGVIVALVPEGLLPTVTLSLAVAARRMASRKVLVRTLSAVETLGCATVICTDKTGTLTQNVMAAREIRLADGAYRITGEGYAPVGEFQTLSGKIVDGAGNPLIQRLCRTAVLASTADIPGPGETIRDPTETAIVVAAAKTLDPDGARKNASLVAEVPFDPVRKRMTMVWRLSSGERLACLKGAPEIVLESCSKRAVATGEEPLTPATREKILRDVRGMAEQAMRVLAVADRALREGDADVPEEGYVWLGLVGLEDPPRPEVAGAIATCRRAGVRVVMLTGDNPATAKAIASQIGLVPDGQEAAVFTPAELHGAAAIRRALEKPGAIFARMTPAYKLAIVAALQHRGEIVAVTGDGVNDAPALKKADIGVAMGIAGTEVAKEASDIILLDDNFASLVAGIEEGRAVYANIRKFLSYILTSNVPELVPYLAFVLLAVPLPLTIIQILAVDLGTDMLPALALGQEPPEPDTMQRPPRPVTERLLSWPVLVHSYLVLGPVEALAGMAGFFWILFAGGWAWGAPLGPTDPLYLQATTMCLTAIIVTQVANGLTHRSERTPLRRLGLLGNRVLLWGIAFELALQALIVYHPAFNKVFGTYPIPLKGWLFLVPFAIMLLAVNEVRKEVVFGRGSRAVPA